MTEPDSTRVEEIVKDAQSCVPIHGLAPDEIYPWEKQVAYTT